MTHSVVSRRLFPNKLASSVDASNSYLQNLKLWPTQSFPENYFSKTRPIQSRRWTIFARFWTYLKTNLFKTKIRPNFLFCFVKKKMMLFWLCWQPCIACPHLFWGWYRPSFFGARFRAWSGRDWTRQTKLPTTIVCIEIGLAKVCISVLLMGISNLVFGPFFGTLAHWMRETRGQISRVVRQGFECRRLCDADRGGAILIIGGRWDPAASKYLGRHNFYPENYTHIPCSLSFGC